MPLSDLGTKAENIEGRIMNAFIDDAGTYQSFGVVKNVEVSLSEVTADADVAQREKQLAVDIEVSFDMEQTGDLEFTAVKDIVNASGNGHTIKTTNSPSSDGTGPGMEFQNVFPNVSGTVNGSGEGSMFSVSFKGRVVPSKLDALPNGSVAFNA